MVSPVIVWNARHGWVSLAFQGGRGAAARLVASRAGRRDAARADRLSDAVDLRPARRRAASPARARGCDDERRLFLVCLALPPILVFTLTPLWGARGLPHWPMPGWFFAFPLMGAWLGEPWAARFRLERWAIASAGLIGAIAVLVVTQAATGWATRLVPLRAGAVDPTLETLDWGALRAAPALRDAAFVVATKWMEGGKIALALGSRTPVFVFSDDPRGMAFLDDSARFVGRDGAIVVPERRAAIGR